MRFLRIFGFGFVHNGRFWQVIGIKIFLHVIANAHHCFSRQTERIGTHIGNQADCPRANIHALIQALRHAHGARSGKAKFTHRLLL